MNKSTLQRKLDRLSRLNKQAFDLRAEISEYCVERWGADPADVDYDRFIDAVEANGGGGYIDVNDFIEGMDERCSQDSDDLQQPAYIRGAR